MLDGILRIKKLAEGQRDPALNKVVDYLCSREDMNEKYLNKEKTLEKMIAYIRSEAKKKAVNGVAMIEDEVVYGWAIHYFDEKDENLEISEQVNSISKKEEKKTENIKKIDNSNAQVQLTLF